MISCKALLVYALPVLAHSLAAERVAWDGLRFLQQSSKFVKLPFRSVSKTGEINPGDMLWTPGSDASFTMAPLDDVVMGGASASTFDQTSGTWSAQVTDANNGGFVGIRNTPSIAFNAETCRGLQWDIRLDGKIPRNMKFILRDSDDFNGITWTYIANLKPGRNTVKIPFQNLIAAKFANIIPDQTFDVRRLSGVQITYSKFEFNGKLSPGFTPGDLRLQLLSLKAY